MTIEILATSEGLTSYSSWLQGNRNNNFWQSLERRKFQVTIGREVRVYACREGEKILAAAMVVIDAGNRGLAAWDIPRGPVWEKGQEKAAMDLFEKILDDAKKANVLSVTYSPLENLPKALPQAKKSTRHEQAEATRILDLSVSEDEILAQMHQKGRYNIRVAEKNGVEVKQSDDVDTFYAIMKKTGERDAFGILPLTHFKTFLECIPGSFLFLAYKDSVPVAGFIGVTYEKTGIYYYGASSYEFRSLMAPYALQWAAIRHCKTAGCTRYDLLGVAPPGSNERHPWARLSDFKSKFGGEVISYPPEQEVVLRPFIKGLLGLKRKLVG